MWKYKNRNNIQSNNEHLITDLYARQMELVFGAIALIIWFYWIIIVNSLNTLDFESNVHNTYNIML